jgi:L-ribulose-5-phosphate 3-epimerase
MNLPRVLPASRPSARFDMSRLKIGVRLESLGSPLRRGLQEVERMGASGVQVDAVGELAPDRLSQTGRRELRHLLRSHNLEMAAVGCPLRRGLDVAENQELRIEHVKKVLTLGFDLGARLVIVEAGKVGSEESAGLMFEALRTLGQFGDKTGAILALTTGLDPPDVLARFLDRFDTGSLAANLDPAALLINGFDPISAVRSLNQRIRHVYARDARRAGASREAQEVAPGHGDIDWMQFLGALEEIDYRSWITIVRKQGDARLADVSAGVAILRRLGV